MSELGITCEFTNRFTRALPADPIEGGGPRPVNGAAFSRVQPTPVAAPEVIAVSAEMMELLGLDEIDADVFAGNRLPDGADPFAMAYGGHQFGNWAGQLGDGRAIALGEVRATDGSYQTLQLKGPGLTPYSRGADGRAVLRSSVREFLCSEAMHHLGVPTTRALCLVGTGEKIVRDMFYDGRPEAEPGAIVCRVAPSFTRFGNFQLPAARGDLDLLGQLVTFTIGADFPGRNPDDVIGWFNEVVERTAKMIVEWMRVGFVHGVMNTDNMSILGLTIDYGPYGWLDDFDPEWTPNTTDAGTRRYRYGQQPLVGQWNLAQFGSAIASLVPDQIEDLQAGLDRYQPAYQAGFEAMMTAKLGLTSFDADLVEELHHVLTVVETDMSIFYRRLAQIPTEADSQTRLAAISDAWYVDPTADARARIDAWLETYLRVAPAERAAEMNRVNPNYVLRNYLAQEAIDAAESGDYSMIADLLDTLRRPFDEQPEREAWAAKRPDWARSRPGCSQLSCSS